jgi:hypothetical protein
MTMAEYAKPLRFLKIDEMGKEQVLEVLRPLRTTRPETVSRFRGRTEAVLDAVWARDHRSGEAEADERPSQGHALC